MLLRTVPTLQLHICSAHLGIVHEAKFILKYSEKLAQINLNFRMFVLSH